MSTQISTQNAIFSNINYLLKINEKTAIKAVFSIFSISYIN